MTQKEVARLQSYLRSKFNVSELKVVMRNTKDDSAEVMIGEEFIGVVFKDDEDEDVSYDFHMAIMDLDLPPE